MADKENIITDWCLGLWDKPTDYILTEGLLDALPTLYQQDEIIFQYNQWKQKWSEKSCTLFSPVWAISDLMNIEIPLSTIKEWDELSYSKWRRKGNWRYVAMWVEHICDCYNASNLAKWHWKVAYYSVDIKDNELVKKILDKRYTICTGYQWNAKYNNDKNDNWVLDGTSFGSSTYWHAVNTIWSINENPARIKDNYYWTSKYNIYDLAHNFSELSCFYDRWYVITKVSEDNFERVKELNEFRTILIQTIEYNSAMWHKTKDVNYQKKLNEMNNANRQKLKDIDEQLKLLVG